MSWWRAHHVCGGCAAEILSSTELGSDLPSLLLQTCLEVSTDSRWSLEATEQLSLGDQGGSSWCVGGTRDDLVGANHHPADNLISMFRCNSGLTVPQTAPTISL